MDTLGLSLRQKKLLHFLRGSQTFTTGNALARQLGVSSRTIRSDVAEINEALAPYKARIYSEHSKGYMYVAEDPEAIQNMNQIDIAFLNRDERVRYLAFRFCLSDEPVDLYDLEDEIFVSHTTLEHDIRALKMKYVLSGPRIRLIQEKSSVSFEPNEQKRRYILNQLLHADWDYHGRNNAYYGYHFLEKEWIDTLLQVIPRHLRSYHIELEDPNLVALDLAVAIMIHRIRSGHSLPEDKPVMRTDPEVSAAADDLFRELSDLFGEDFSRTEQDAIYRLIAGVRLPDMFSIRMDNVHEHFSSVTIRLADIYLEKIDHQYGLDLSADHDFYFTLLFFLRYLQISDHIFYGQENRDIARENLLPEFEIAWGIQDPALEYLGYYLTELELLHLAYLISGALEFYSDTHPEHKIRTIIFCHMNMTAAWALKRKILAAFGKYLNVTDLLPVNSKDVWEFKNTELILSTVRKPLTNDPNIRTIKISPLLPPDDYLKISAFIQSSRITALCPGKNFSIGKLLEDAVWIEKTAFSRRFEIIEEMAGSLIREGIVPPDYEADLLRREAISSFGIRPGLLFLHSLVPAVKTRLAVAIFEHQIIWNSHKIRIAVMGAFRPEDTVLVLKLNQILNDPSVDPEAYGNLRTREEILRFFQSI